LNTENAKYQNDKGIRIQLSVARELRAHEPFWDPTESAIRETDSPDYQKNKDQIAVPKEHKAALTASRNRVTRPEPLSRQVRKGGEGKVNWEPVEGGAAEGQKHRRRRRTLRVSCLSCHHIPCFEVGHCSVHKIIYYNFNYPKWIYSLRGDSLFQFINLYLTIDKFLLVC
jgi:hypothetical protein